MSYVLNIILIHTNYFKNDYRLIINLSLLNKNYFKSINDVYKNYLFDEFPKLKNLNFGHKSWINLYHFTLKSPLRPIILENIDMESNIFTSLKDELFLYIEGDSFGIAPLSEHKTNLTTSVLKNNIRINYEKIKQQIKEFLFHDILFSSDINNTNYYNSINWEISEYSLRNRNELRPLTIKFLERICLVYNKPYRFDTIISLMKNKMLIIDKYSLGIKF